MTNVDVFASVFGTGNLTEFDSTNESPTVVTSPTHCGTYACKFDKDEEVVEVTPSPALDELYARYYIRYDTEPAGGTYELIRSIHFVGNGVSIGRCYMESRPGGKAFRMHTREPSTIDYIVYYNWQINTWYCIEFYFKKHASSGCYRMYVNDALIAERNGIDTSGADSCDEIRFGSDYCNPTSIFTNVYIDCIAIADSGPIGTHENFSNGFEEGDFSAYNAVVGNPQIDGDNYHCGVYSMEASVVPYGSEGAYIHLGHHKEVHLQFEVKFEDTAISSGDSVLFAYIRDVTSSDDIIQLFITNESGTVKWGYSYRGGGSLTTVTEDTIGLNPSSNTWYCVDIEIVMSSRDGDTEGSYKMYIDGSLCDDIDVSSIDTDYTGIAHLRLVTYTEKTGGAIVYYDCPVWQTTDIGACHAAGSVEPAEPIEAEEDCVPPESTDWLQVYRNCQRINVESLTVESTERGMGKITVPFSCPVNRGNLFHIIVEGSTILQGRVVSIARNRGQGTKTLECQTKSARLYSRYVLSESHRTYNDEDVGAIAKDLIDYYFDGLFTSVNVNTNTGTTISDIDCYDKTVGDALEELAKRGNATFYIDGDNDVHFFVKGMEDSNAVFDYTNIVGDIVVDEVGEVVGTVIVKGLTGISGTAGSGLPEVLHSDRRITTNEEAQEVAEALLDKYGETITIKFPVTGFFNLKHGQSATLDAPLDKHANESIIISGVSWNLTPNNCRTNITLGELPVSYENLILQMVKEIKEQQVNRISNHIGSDTGSGDPTLEREQILYLATGSEYNVTTGAVTLRSGTCSSASDPSSIAEIGIYLEIGASGGSGEFIFWVEDGTGYNYGGTFSGKLDSNLGSVYRRILVWGDLSGLTLYLKAMGDASCNVYIKGLLQANQFLGHAHDVVQASEHGFD